MNLPLIIVFGVGFYGIFGLLTTVILDGFLSDAGFVERHSLALYLLWPITVLFGAACAIWSIPRGLRAVVRSVGGLYGELFPTQLKEHPDGPALSYRDAPGDRSKKGSVVRR